jgi:cell division protein FtsN
MKNETRKLDQALMYLVFVFVTLLAFSLGVFAGKEFSDQEYGLIELNSKEYSHEKFASAIQRREEVAPAISQDKIAEMANAAVREAEEEERRAAAAKEARAVASTPTPAAPAAQAQPTTAKQESPTAALDRAAERVASGQTPSAAKPVDPRLPQRLPDSVGATQIAYTVQVASYPSQEEATNHANELVKKGFSAFHVPAEVKGKTWYRVSVGSFKTSAEATSFKEDFLRRSGEKTAIVQKIGR